VGGCFVRLWCLVLLPGRPMLLRRCRGCCCPVVSGWFGLLRVVRLFCAISRVVISAVAVLSLSSPGSGIGLGAILCLLGCSLNISVLLSRASSVCSALFCWVFVALICFVVSSPLPPRFSSVFFSAVFLFAASLLFGE